jgi:uncharacterized protein (DUF433 family)
MGNTPALEARPVPLDRLPNGVLRVAGTRIGLDLVIGAFKAGETPEQIVEAYDSLRLADVYALIAYYLDHAAEVEEYLRAYEESAQEVRRRIEATQSQRPGFREELLKRWARREAGNAANGDGR